MAIVGSKVSIIDNSQAGTPDEYIVFLSSSTNAETVKAVPGCYGHTVQKVRHSTIIRGFIDMRYTTADVEDGLISAAARKV